jgi:hypothetical protein
MCKKPFHSIGSKICPSCLEQIDKDFIVVRDYIYEHVGAHIDDVSEETGVSKQTIMHLLREGRLQLDNPDADGMLVCEVCKKPINSGRMCDECKDSVASTMKKSISDQKPAEGPAKDSDQSSTKSLRHGGAKMSTRTLLR